MGEITLVRDDLVPFLESLGVAAKIEVWALKNMGMETLICRLQSWAEDLGIDLDGMDSYQVEHMLSDLAKAGMLSSAALIEGSNVEAVIRAAAPSGIGIGNGNVWVNPPNTPYVLRFYTNGELKLALTDYYITTLESIGAASGDMVQICRVVDGTVGWWASKLVP